MNVLALIGHKVNTFLSHAASISKMTAQTLYWAFIAPFTRKTFTYDDLAFQMARAGVGSIGIVGLVSFLIGMILVMQTAYMVEPYGQLNMVPGGVAVSLTRAIGPLIIAIVVTGRVGAAYTAELGSMNVSDEIMALECMAINPVGFLVAPRFLAMIVMLPALIVFGNIIGMCGGCLIGVLHYGIDFGVYWETTVDMLENKDILSGIMKSVVFAVIITMMGAYKGFTVTGGSTGVGRSTMESVVNSILLIIASDALFTAIINFYFN